MSVEASPRSSEPAPDERWPGLGAEEAARGLRADGPNELPSEERRSLLVLLRDVIKEPMFLLLLGSAALYLVFGDLKEGLTLLGFVLVVITITVVQEGRTERALGALRELSSPQAQALRSGRWQTLQARELVRGDIIRVAEGDRVPADALLRAGATLTVDESLLTGESVPVCKIPDTAADAPSAPGGDGSSTLFSGTLVVSGRGLAEVCRTGERSELGRIGASLAKVTRERTPLQREVDRVVRRMALLGVGLSALLVLIRGLGGDDWREAALSGIALAMALLPEEFPVVLTVFLALGAWRIARVRVLARRVTAVETLGAVQVLCTDKTGTLTQNRMAIRRLVTAEDEVDLAAPTPASLPESVHALVEFGILASPRDPFDPMEKAFHALGALALGGTEHLHPDWEAARESPVTPVLLPVPPARRAQCAGDLVVPTKGAPEAVFDLCHLEPAAAARWREVVARLAGEGLRVLGVARSREPVTRAPTHPHEVPFELLGLVGLEDPLRADVPAAIALCHRAGVRVLMITGDHPDTARAIARRAGLAAEVALSGSQIEAMDEPTLAAALLRTDVVARAVPAPKLRLVRPLGAPARAAGMTGDGVNDAPALKPADIGIAMGLRGTDVAREAASLVLVQDDFGPIVDAVRIGRRIYDNLKKAVGYIIAVHLPIAGLSLLPALLGWAPVLTPVHVVFLEIVIDPSCSVVFEMEPEEPDVMRRPPRSRAARVFAWRGVLLSVAQGLLALVGALWLLLGLRADGADEPTQRTLGFVALVSGNLAILLCTRSRTEPFWRTLRRWNPALPILIGVTATVLAVVLMVPALRGLFGFVAIDTAAALLAAAHGAALVLLLDTVKLRRHEPSRP